MNIGFMELKNALASGDLEAAAAQMVAMYWQSGILTGLFINNARSEYVQFKVNG